MRLTKEALTEKLLARVASDRRAFATKTLHLVGRALPARTSLQIGPSVHEVAKDSFLVIIDEAPEAYWTHPVRYELHEVETGEIQVIQTKYPLEAPDVKADLVALHIPDLPGLKKRREGGFFEQPRIGDRLAEMEERFGAASFDLPAAQAAHRHALFVAGDDNMPDFHNDFLAMRNLLLERYGYDPSHIVIVMGAPSAYPDLPVDYPGTVAGLDSALDAYAAGGARALGPDDHLFLYTFDHGDADATGSSLCMLPKWSIYRSSRMKAKLDDIHCGELIVAMNQCHSGGFIDDVITSTGPASIAIITTCRGDQLGYGSGASVPGGYFSGALMAALNWGFPAEIPADFPGYVAGEITTHDANNDGLVSAEEAWNFIDSEMNAHHWYTINGFSNPQYGVSAAGAGASLFWGLPDIEVLDGAAPAPWWESPDVFLMDPAVIPDDVNTVVGSPAYWGDDYRPDTMNRIVARIHNFGCAPARRVNVEVRVMSFGAAAVTTLVGSSPINNIDPGHHAYAPVDWDFPSAMVHRCAMARADCPADPAAAFGTSITTDDNQAQRNLDPNYVLPFAAQNLPRAIERRFLIHNTLREPAVFAIKPAGPKPEARWVQVKVDGVEAQDRIVMEASQRREINVVFQFRGNAEPGEKVRFAVEISRVSPRPSVLGGVTLTVETAVGRLEGIVLAHALQVAGEGTVTIANVKQPKVRYEARLDRKGRYSFRDIVPGSYTMMANCPEGIGKSAVFVQPNRITKKIMTLERQHVWIGELLREERPVAHPAHA